MADQNLNIEQPLVRKELKVLLVSEVPLSENRGGISQTLYNLLLFCEPHNLLAITYEKEVKLSRPTFPFERRYVSYNFEFLELMGTRFSKYYEPVLRNLNFLINSFRSFSRLKNAIRVFNPDVIISCPNSAIGIFMHQKLLKKSRVKIFPYFMDDWMYQDHHRRAGFDIHAAIRQMLSLNKDWLMISEELAGVLSERYQVKPQNNLVVRNPVNLDNAPALHALKKREIYRIAYAGALWPMHFDAFLALASALKELEPEIGIEFSIYTYQSMWDWREPALSDYPVRYGGNIPYKDIHETLSNADILIVTSSFSKEFYTHTAASVQTKITDYLKSGRLIVSIGPQYSANNGFLKKYDCGVCIETQDPLEIAASLKDILNNIQAYEPMIHRGRDILAREFSFTRVHDKLNSFLESNSYSNMS